MRGSRHHASMRHCVVVKVPQDLERVGRRYGAILERSRDMCLRSLPLHTRLINRCETLEPTTLWNHKQSTFLSPKPNITTPNTTPNPQATCNCCAP